MEALFGLGIAGYIGYKLILKPFWLLVSPANARRAMPGIFGPPTQADIKASERKQVKAPRKEVGFLRKLHDFVFVRSI